MSEASVRALLERAEADPGFRERLEAASSKEEKRQVVADAGFDVGPDDLDTVRSITGMTEISDSDLERIAGGMSTGSAVSAVASAAAVPVTVAASVAAAAAV